MNGIFLNIFAIALVPSGMFGVIYEYIIWDKSIVPDWLYWGWFIFGWVALIGLIITLVIDKKLKSYKADRS